MAIDTFLKLDAIDGESQDDQHGKEIHVMSWTWGESQSGTSSIGGGAGAGKVSMSDFTIMTELGSQSPKLMLYCASGKVIPTAKLSCRKAGAQDNASGKDYLVIDFKNVLVTSYQLSGSSENPMESVSFNFEQINTAYQPQNDDGSLGAAIKFGWNVKNNKAP